MAYQIPGLLLLASALVAGTLTLAAPTEKLWAIASFAAAVVTLGMVVSYVSLTI